MGRDASLRIFINYRRDDTSGAAVLAYNRLAEEFGRENVFLDTHSLEPGMKWLEQIKSRGATCGVFLALIGDRWMPMMREREQSAAEDYVRFEIEHALRRTSGLHVIPVVIDDAVPPVTDRLPRSLQPLAGFEVEQLRYKRIDDDLDRLIARLKTIAREQPAPAPQPLEMSNDVATLPVPNHIAPPPDVGHIDLVLRHMVGEGNLVPLLGSRMKQPPPPSYPDAEELAADLADRFGLELGHIDLAEVAQYVYMMTGSPDLFRTLTQIFTAERPPGPVHRFLAQLPGQLAARGFEKRYQMIVSTTFDMALERAFDEEGEPYDLAVYMASGRDEGKFVHFPYERDPEPIETPNNYGKFPIGDYGELERTVIVKIHGAVDGNLGSYRWKENYVITEDHYIDYLSLNAVESLVPVQILDKLRESHCLFLGYSMRDWNLRVFLKRIWRGTLSAKSWAIEPDPDRLEKEFWLQSHVELYTSDLAEYMNQLLARLDARRRDAA